MGLVCVYRGITGVPRQTVTHAVPAKRRVSFMRGLKCELFIYFALIFLKEAFQGSFCADFLEFATWAQLLSLRGANNLISLLFTCSKFRSLACSVGRSCPTCYCNSALQEWKSPSWLYTGKSENLISFLAVLGFRQLPAWACNQLRVCGRTIPVAAEAAGSCSVSCSPFSKLIWPQQS